MCRLLRWNHQWQQRVSTVSDLGPGKIRQNHLALQAGRAYLGMPGGPKEVKGYQRPKKCEDTKEIKEMWVGVDEEPNSFFLEITTNLRNVAELLLGGEQLDMKVLGQNQNMIKR